MSDSERKLVYESWGASYRREGTVRDYTEEEKQLNRRSQEEADTLVEKIQQSIKDGGDVYKYSGESFRAIYDNKKRMEAYRSVTVKHDVIPDEEAKIKESPFKYLHLDSNATRGQLRVAWIRLANIWHPDHVNPYDAKKLEQYVGRNPSFLEKNDTLEKWAMMVKRVEVPDVLAIEEIDKLNDCEKEDYYKQHKAYEIIQNLVKRIENEMLLISGEKMKTINRAYKYAKETFSKAEQQSLDGFQWETVFREYREGCRAVQFEDEVIYLEGEGTIQRQAGRLATWKMPKLHFGYGEKFNYSGYFQEIFLQSFFAWMELRQGKELSPLLLTDIVEGCELDSHKAEQLRLMLMNNESVDFMLKALDISGRKEWKLIHPANDLLYGPMYNIEVNFEEDSYFPLGVELTKDGGMVLKYRNQGIISICPIGGKTQTNFTADDVKMMRAIAYGPLLQEMDKDI